MKSFIVLFILGLLCAIAGFILNSDLLIILASINYVGAAIILEVVKYNEN